MSLIDDILDLSKVEKEKIVLKKVQFSLLQLLQDISESLAKQLQAKAITFAINCSRNLPVSIVADPLCVKQILIDTISNAIKFTDVGSVTVDVKLAFSQLNKYQLVFTVKLAGRGLAVEKGKRLFKAFMQADKTTIKKYGGAGLGLILSRRLAHAMGGDVELSWSEPTKVSSVTITIDVGLHEAGHQQNGGERSHFAPNSLQNKAVLIVDDAPDNLMLFRLILEKHGALVETAANGIEAVKKALNSTYDIVLMDLQMPLQDGFSAALELRERGFSNPILALSALAMKDELEKALKSGCNDHLAKPVNAQQLIGKVMKLIGPLVLH